GIQFFGISLVPATNNQIGGIAPGAGNVIAFNGTQGIRLDNSGVLSGESILGNAIYSNGALGIDLAPVGINVNDSGDADTGVNNRQNYPAVTSANSTDGVLTVAGTFNSVANKTYRLEFFANSTCDPLGNGEGQTYLGSTTVTTDPGGNVAFSVP